MTRMTVTGFLCLASLAMAQDVHYDYDRSANFGAYRSYQWVDSSGGRASNRLADQNIRRAVDAELAARGLRLVESGGDLQVDYEAAIAQEKEFSGFGSGPRWHGTGRVTTSTIQIGKLTISFFETARKRLVWRGEAQQTLNVNKDPDKNYRKLEKAVAKILRNLATGRTTD